MSECRCQEYCARWGRFSDNSGHWYTPYVPGLPAGESMCKALKPGHKMKQTIVDPDKKRTLDSG